MAKLKLGHTLDVHSERDGQLVASVFNLVSRRKYSRTEEHEDTHAVISLVLAHPDAMRSTLPWPHWEDDMEVAASGQELARVLQAWKKDSLLWSDVTEVLMDHAKLIAAKARGDK